MKREIKVIPLVLSVLGFFAVGLCWGSLSDVATQTELIIGIVFGAIALKLLGNEVGKKFPIFFFKLIKIKFGCKLFFAYLCINKTKEIC